MFVGKSGAFDWRERLLAHAFQRCKHYVRCGPFSHTLCCCANGLAQLATACPTGYRPLASPVLCSIKEKHLKKAFIMRVCIAGGVFLYTGKLLGRCMSKAPYILTYPGRYEKMKQA